MLGEAVSAHAGEVPRDRMGQYRKGQHEEIERLQMLKDEGYRAVVTEGYQETMDEILNYLSLWP